MFNDPYSQCQIPALSKIAEGEQKDTSLPFLVRFKRRFAKVWNYTVKNRLKKIDKTLSKKHKLNTTATIFPEKLQAGDWVRVRPAEDIQSTLDRWHELKGCAFLSEMWQYCGTTQRVLVRMERFLDERDYKVKKCNGIVLLEGLMCTGTPVFGRCDRRCHFFWREEWLEKINSEDPVYEAANSSRNRE
ncbi:hypothetical protein BECAL_02883 [Bellilinea caldifistulae]|uniref:Uncharacterized protein n=1 Tax=Bellilinea caldifistulae TaxID=360411 RepID=A0A0P6X3S8_9CHLR|nr:hypothetical protein [Bellilinea caldifistulae]KPL74491.1 hypothetical protein AC812_11840 [Bellilinea caldifistulae]GAP11692.1 hypothetical protein BECAL_02883 [Bellilinea caldifistulae]